MPYADRETHLRKNRERQQTAHGAANHARANREYRRRNAKKLAAHNAISKAIMRGKLTPWPVCALPRCDGTDVEAHHADYDQPLDVVWLCGRHHKAAHRLKKLLDRQAQLRRPPA